MLSARLGSVAALAVLLSLGITGHFGPLTALGAIVGKGGLDPCSTRSGTAPHDSFCDKFYECIQNVTRVKDCPNGLAYVGGAGRAGRGNQLFGNCEYDFNVDCSGRPKRTLVHTTVAQKKGTDQINPCDVKGKIVGDITYCDRYWECVGGQPELYDCPNGLAFAGRNRGVADGCDYPWRGNYCEGKQLANPPISTDHCDWLYGIFGHETSCTRYWTCWNGTATEQLCIGGLLYNEDTHACDWPENVPGCQKHPLCKDDANGNVPLGKSCNRYWQCQGGYPRLQRCPAMLVFDKKSLRCVVPPTEDCDIPSTTTPPPEEDENQPQQQQSRPQQGGQGQNRRPAQSGNRPVVQATQLREQQHRDRTDHRDNQYKERTDNRDQQQKDRSDQVQRDRSDQAQRDRSEVRDQQREQKAGSSNVPVYVVQEANASSEEEAEQQDFVGGNRQL